MVLRSFWRQNQLHSTHSFQENTILVNQFGWCKILMAKIQCVLSHYCNSFHETIYKGTNMCEQQTAILTKKIKDILLFVRLRGSTQRNRKWIPDSNASMRECQFIQVSCSLSLFVIYFGLLVFCFCFFCLKNLRKKSVQLIMIVVDTKGDTGMVWY